MPFNYKIILVFFLCIQASIVQAQYQVKVTANKDQFVFVSDKHPLAVGDKILNKSDLEFWGRGSNEFSIPKKKFSSPYFVIVEEKGKRVQLHEITDSDDVYKLFAFKKSIFVTIPEGENLYQRQKNDLNIIMDDMDVEFELKFSSTNPNTQWKIEEFENDLSEIFNGIVNKNLTNHGFNKNNTIEDTHFKNHIRLRTKVKISEEHSYYSSRLNLRINFEFLDSYGTLLREKMIIRNIDSIEQLYYVFSFNVAEVIQSDRLKQTKKEIQQKLKNARSFNLNLSVNNKTPDQNLTNAIQSVVTVQTEKGHGSGCLISNIGHILTNHHVVNETDTIKIITQSGDTLKTSYLRSDPTHDLALLKVDSLIKFQHHFSLDTTSSIEPVGNSIFIIGTPADLMLTNTLSKGFLSGYRPNINDGIYQVGVSVNPGNSGGALVNSQGKLIGIVNAKKVGYGVKKIGYAVPIHLMYEALNISLTNQEQ